MVDDRVPTIISRDERHTPREGADAIISAIVASALDALRTASVQASDVVAAGCSSPGPLDHISGRIIETPNLVGFRDIALADRLSDALRTRVYLDRPSDSNPTHRVQRATTCRDVGVDRSAVSKRSLPARSSRSTTASKTQRRSTPRPSAASRAPPGSSYARSARSRISPSVL